MTAHQMFLMPFFINCLALFFWITEKKRHECERKSACESSGQEQFYTIHRMGGYIFQNNSVEDMYATIKWRGNLINYLLILLYIYECSQSLTTNALKYLIN